MTDDKIERAETEELDTMFEGVRAARIGDKEPNTPLQSAPYWERGSNVRDREPCESHELGRAKHEEIVDNKILLNMRIRRKQEKWKRKQGKERHL